MRRFDRGKTAGRYLKVLPRRAKPIKSAISLRCVRNPSADMPSLRACIHCVLAFRADLD